jgi:hypothetical protein
MRFQNNSLLEAIDEARKDVAANPGLVVAVSICLLADGQWLTEITEAASDDRVQYAKREAT